VLFIGIIILCLTLFVFLEIFYQLLNDDIHWWFVFVGVVIAATLVVASSFIIVFFTNDTESSRGKLFVSCLLVIGIALEAIWAACYFVFLYKKDTVVTGNDGVGFIKATRKQEVVVTLYIAACICALFAYFICVVGQYVDVLKTPEEEMMMEEMMMEEKKDDMMMEEKPADMMMDGEAEPMMMEEAAAE